HWAKTGAKRRRAPAGDPALIAPIEPLRRVAALRMGLGDVAGKVLPKFAIVAPPRNGGTLAARYFVPWNCHSAFAVTGALCLGAAARIPDTVAYGVARQNEPGV